MGVVHERSDFRQPLEQPIVGTPGARLDEEDQITANDPLALTERWHVVRRYRKAAYPNDELREFACAEGLRARGTAEAVPRNPGR